MSTTEKTRSKFGSAICVVLLAIAVPAQGGDQNGTQGGDAPPGGNQADAGTSEGAADGISPDEVPPGTYRDGSMYFMATASLRPRRLAPGQSGRLFVTVTLRGRNVVLPASHIELRIDSARLPLSLGPSVLRPAIQGTRQGRYRGEPIHEDNLVFELPVTVQPDAKHRKLAVKGSLELGLHDAKSGEFRGLFSTKIRGMIAIGPPLPVGKLIKRLSRDGEPGAESSTSTDPPGATASGTQEAALRPNTGGQSAHEPIDTPPVDPEAAPGQTEPEPNDTEATIGSWTWIGIGGAIAAILAMLVRSRRRA